MRSREAGTSASSHRPWLWPVFAEGLACRKDEPGGRKMGAQGWPLVHVATALYGSGFRVVAWLRGKERRWTPRW